MPRGGTERFGAEVRGARELGRERAEARADVEDADEDDDRVEEAADHVPARRGDAPEDVERKRREITEREHSVPGEDQREEERERHAEERDRHVRGVTD